MNNISDLMLHLARTIEDHGDLPICTHIIGSGMNDPIYLKNVIVVPNGIGPSLLQIKVDP